MEPLYIIVPLLVISILIFVVVPLIIRLRPNMFKFAVFDEQGFMTLNDKQSRCFAGIKLLKGANNIKSQLVIAHNEGIKKVNVTIAVQEKKNTIIKSYILNFKDKSEVSIPVSNDYRGIQVYINQVNDEPFKEVVIQHVSKKQITLFSVLETILFASFAAVVLSNFIMISPFPERGTFEIPCLICITIAIVVAVFFAIYFTTNKILEKYNNGGYIND